MNWNEYKQTVRESDPAAAAVLAEAEEEAAIISALISRRNELGLTQRDLAELCKMPQSSIARIESCKTTPNLETLLHITRAMGLTLTLTAPPASGSSQHASIHA